MHHGGGDVMMGVFVAHTTCIIGSCTALEDFLCMVD